jgi:threonine-phosphate decarboxylase
LEAFGKIRHGGDWAGYEADYGKPPLDFSASISPLGLPDGVRRAAISALREADRYPDPLCRELRGALSAYHDVPAENIVCGNGAADLIYRLCRVLHPERAAVFAPCFGEYQKALRAEGCTVTEISLAREEHFRLTEETIGKIPEKLDVAFLCNPNNPTGLLTPKEILRGLLEREGFLIADECFLDFCERAADYSLIGELSKHPRLVILRAFTKVWAMAGLRLGYALCGSADLARDLQDCGQPWAVSGVAQRAGVAALRETEYAEKLRALIGRERRRMLAEFEKLGLLALPGEANFLLFLSADKTLDRKLRERGILIRDCADFTGLTKGWYRAAVRTKAENDRLLAALKGCLHG